MNDLPDHEFRRLRTVAESPRALDDLIARRLGGEPLQYLEGSAAFGPFDLLVDPRVLVPRPETEQLWELSAGMADVPSIIVDLCTGSGALAIALATSFVDARVYGTDVSADALDVARENGIRCGTDVVWSQGDLFAALPTEIRGAVDLIVSNPPYVSLDEYGLLPADVQREPRIALVAGPSGLEVLSRIVESLPDWLSADGVFALEIGEAQGTDVLAMFDSMTAELRKDLAGRDRFIAGRRP